MDNLSLAIRSIRSLQQQPNDELDQFISLCQTKDRELAQHRQELQRIRQTLTEVRARKIEIIIYVNHSFRLHMSYTPTMADS